ncbi:hypothetical protein [Catenovulum maritimum]|uniref:hypothetical protein n=1 Tax=Catenovulum maritimum TaxID=1513271 RepID=UPI00122E26BE|nr:hypothetical protein [Catenovulum maritimum]
MNIRILIGLICFVFSSVASAEILVIVNKNNPISSMSKQEIIYIYTGRLMAFSNGEQAQPIDLYDGSQEKATFYKITTGKRLSQINSYWAKLSFTGRLKPPLALETQQAAVEYVVNNANAIAYIDEKYLTDDVKVVFRLDS